MIWITDIVRGEERRQIRKRKPDIISIRKAGNIEAQV